jgi:hypothetical protein
MKKPDEKNLVTLSLYSGSREIKNTEKAQNSSGEFNPGVGSSRK